MKVVGKNVRPTTEGVKTNWKVFTGKITHYYKRNDKTIVSVKWNNSDCDKFGTSNLILNKDVELI